MVDGQPTKSIVVSWIVSKHLLLWGRCWSGTHPVMWESNSSLFWRVLSIVERLWVWGGEYHCWIHNVRLLQWSWYFCGWSTCIYHQCWLPGCSWTHYCQTMTIFVLIYSRDMGLAGWDIIQLRSCHLHITRMKNNSHCLVLYVQMLYESYQPMSERWQIMLRGLQLLNCFHVIPLSLIFLSWVSKFVLSLSQWTHCNGECFSMWRQDSVCT